jgi:vacuolar-type H+-ATPase subunit H
MGVERVLSMGERLQRLLDGAEKEAEAKVVEAEQKAADMISKARADAERRRTMAQRGYGIDELLKEAEEKATKEAEKKLKDYIKQAEVVKDAPEEKMKEAVALVLKEVLPE